MANRSCGCACANITVRVHCEWVCVCLTQKLKNAGRFLRRTAILFFFSFCCCCYCCCRHRRSFQLLILMSCRCVCPFSLSHLIFLTSLPSPSLFLSFFNLPPEPTAAVAVHQNEAQERPGPGKRYPFLFREAAKTCRQLHIFCGRRQAREARAGGQEEGEGGKKQSVRQAGSSRVRIRKECVITHTRTHAHMGRGDGSIR